MTANSSWKMRYTQHRKPIINKANRSRYKYRWFAKLSRVITPDPYRKFLEYKNDHNPRFTKKVSFMTTALPIPMYTLPQLTASNVLAIFTDCLYDDTTDTTEPIVIEGVTTTCGMNQERITLHRPIIYHLLSQLPTEFKESDGGGWSFLNACVDSTGELWGQHLNVEQLMILGLASGDVTYLLPRALWYRLNSGMPYFIFHDTQLPTPLIADDASAFITY